MRLTILGSSGGYSGPENPTSGFLVKHAADQETTTLWIDAGHGTFSALQRVEDFTRIDAVVVSHVHADHCVDLYALNIALRFHKDGVLRKRLYCPLEVWERMPLLLDSAEGFRSTFDFQPIEDGGVIEVGGVRIRFVRTDHPNYCLAMRLESDEGILTYSADSGPGTDLAGFAQGSDLLLCEATYQEGLEGAPVHLTARQAGDTARRAGVRDLVLTHVWPAYDPQRSLREAREVSGDVRVEWAAPGSSFDVRRDVRR